MKKSLIFAVAWLAASIIVAPVFAQEGALKLPPYKKVALKNGMTLLLMEKHGVPIVSFQFIVKAGATADPAGKEGLASLTAGLLRKGTASRSADQLSAELDFIGGLLNAGADSDYSNGAAEFLKKDLGKGLDILADVILHPTFPQDEVTKMLKQRIDGIKSAKDRAQGVLGNYFNAYLFGSHPYGRPVGGDEKSLPTLTRDDVSGFYQTYYTPSNTILAASGDFNPTEMESLLTEKFGAWPTKPARPISLSAPARVEGKRLLLVNKPDSTQTFYMIGNVGISRTDSDRVTIGVINTLFGGRFTSMLNSELRVNSGLTYGASSNFDRRRLPGPFVISTYTTNKTTEKAIDLTLDVLKRLHEKGITEEELKSAKSYIKGQYPPRVETTDQLAAQVAQLEFYGLDKNEIDGYYAKIDSMTLADAQRVIKEHFPLDNLVFVLIGKASEIEGLAHKYAPRVDTKSIEAPGY
jgi:predicted Zn-dependent peptidase